MPNAQADLAMTGWARRVGGWHDRWLALRDRLLASPVFQRRAASFALTRPTARRHAGQLFDIVAGFVYSQVLLACVELDLFERLAKGPQTAERLSVRLDMPLDAMERLLAAAVAIRLLELRSDGRQCRGRRDGSPSRRAVRRPGRPRRLASRLARTAGGQRTRALLGL
jgi:demethylspheroidene O-methyltransferase